MPGRIAALYRHPVKGFSPERLRAAVLEAGACFPCDRLFAVENGPSGFDPAAPAHLSKMKFTVLANLPALARARTVYDDATGVLEVKAEGFAPFAASLVDEAGRAAFATWLSGFIDADEQRGPLKVFKAERAYRFMDDRSGAISLLNLASVRDLEGRIGRPIDSRRFRANLHIEGWKAWSELDLAPGAEVKVGDATLRVVKPIVRCAATHVDPVTGERDIDMVPALHEAYGHRYCGLYLQVAWGGAVAVGDPAAAVVEEAPFLPAIDPPEIHIS